MVFRCVAVQDLVFFAAIPVRGIVANVVTRCGSIRCAVAVPVDNTVSVENTVLLDKTAHTRLSESLAT